MLNRIIARTEHITITEETQNGKQAFVAYVHDINTYRFDTVTEAFKCAMREVSELTDADMWE